MHQTRAFDVAVVGGGAIGLAIAWRAAQSGMRVVLLERGTPGSATSSVAAGMLAPVTEATPVEAPLLELGLASAAAYPAFVEELRELSGIDPGYLACGSLLLARDPDEAEALERELELRHSMGLAVERVRASEARRREPALAPALRLALEIPDDHAVDPRPLCAALLAACDVAGVELRPGVRVAKLELDGDSVRGVRLAGGEQLVAGQVVLAAGPWCEEIEGLPAGGDVPIRPVKGQILRLHDPAGPGLVGRVLRIGHTYLVPRGDGRYVLGATVEERGFDTTVTAGAVFELFRDLTELVPGASELVIDELSAGLRPNTPDSLPAIGPGSANGLYWAAGHYRSGILLAPITAELIAGLLSGAPTRPELLAPVAPSRFASVPVQA